MRSKILRSSSAPAPIVVGTISTITNATDLTAKTPTLSVTIDRGDGLGAVAIVPEAWDWLQDDSDAGITGPTTATPSIAISAAGKRTVTCRFTIDVDGQGTLREYEAEPESYVVGPTTFSATANQPSGNATGATVTLNAPTVLGGVQPYTYSRVIKGPWDSAYATTNLADATADGTTFAVGSRTLGLRAGKYFVPLTVTDAVGQVVLLIEEFEIGTNGWLTLDLSTFTLVEGSVAGLVTGITSTQLVVENLLADAVSEGSRLRGPALHSGTWMLSLQADITDTRCVIVGGWSLADGDPSGMLGPGSNSTAAEASFSVSGAAMTQGTLQAIDRVTYFWEMGAGGKCSSPGGTTWVPAGSLGTAQGLATAHDSTGETSAELALHIQRKSTAAGVAHTIPYSAKVRYAPADA